MSKEHESLVEAALSLDAELSTPALATGMKPEGKTGDVPDDATEVPDSRNLTVDRAGTTTGKV